MAREAWASAGLLRDELSSTVLTLNLRGTPVLDWAADAGEPCVLTLRQLIRNPPGISAPSIRICENPTVLAAAADVHGDFGWGGLRIASAQLRRVPWLPWSYKTADYRAAALTVRGGPPLTGRPAEAPWDPFLPDALEELGVRIEEETVLDALLSDLAR